MRVLVAPDKFKGSLTASEVATSIAEGLAQSGADAVTLPLADGGDGSVAAALAAGMRPVACTVTISQIDDLEAGLENPVLYTTWQPVLVAERSVETALAQARDRRQVVD
jgi:Glycerate kinase family